MNENFVNQLNTTLNALYEHVWVEPTDNGKALWITCSTWETMVNVSETLVKVYNLVVINYSVRKDVHYSVKVQQEKRR